ncbi:OmpA family protein [Paracrocinitomix mangrovi]|uniref:OmpA family protein n=1 Tax=Paracrocinitomix mangrovi TaxID=2862509 RepID=UPI001C8DD296|nr:OmpA family protein [Paracrocinitomix mangrovi]UKN03089.1 OmpA family protein [Paracrocinitomix mangrovi]
MKQLTIFVVIIMTHFISNGQSTYCDTIFFDLDKYEVNEISKNEFISRIQNQLNGKEVVKIQLTGHTDHHAGNSYNKTLAKNRLGTVIELLSTVGVEDKIKTVVNDGEEKPAFSNSNSFGQAKNRRVDMIIYFKDPVIEKEIIEEEKEEDLIIYGKEGTQLIIPPNSFKEFENSEVNFRIQESYSLSSMISMNLATITDGGSCLRSGGMLFANAFVQGQSVDLDKEITVRIPANDLDTSFKLYDIKVINGDTTWVESDTPLTFNENEGYYEFKTRSMPSVNLDAPVLSPAAEMIANTKNMLKSLFADEGLVVKTKGFDYSKGYLVTKDPNIVRRGDLIKSNKSKYYPCGSTTSDLVIAIVEKKGHYYYFADKLSDVKFKSFWNRYIIKKRDFIEIQLADLEQMVENTLAEEY